MRRLQKFVNKPYVWFILPATIYVFMFTLYPALYGIMISFTDMHFGYTDYRFVGLENYTRLLQWRHLPTVLRNTGVFVGAVVFLQMSFGLLIAMLLNRKVPGRALARSVAIFPWILPAIVIGLMFKQMFVGSRLGIMNALRSSMGLQTVSWLTNPSLAMAIMIGSVTWRGTALSIILQLGGLQTIPDEVNEAAVIDGAHSLQRLWYITLPLLRPSLLINLIMATSGTFNHVDIPLSLTGGGPRRATEVLSLALYKQAFEMLDASLAATIATVILVINLILTLVYLKILDPGSTGLSDQ